MALRDRIAGLGRVAAMAAADALLDWAGDDLGKAKPPGDYNVDEGPETAPGGAEQDTPEDSPVPTDKAAEDPRTLFWDPYAIVEQLGYKERPTQITYGTIKAMIYRMPVAQAVIQTRLAQLASFCRPQRDRYGLGFRIQLRDPKERPTKASEKWAEQMGSLMLRCGVTDNPRGRDTLEAFVKKIAWDSYAYDQLAFEVVPNRRGQPAEWYAADAATMRLADSATTYWDEDRTEAIRYVQIYDGMIIAEYNQQELAFGVRNPRTDLRLYGYGVSEMEMAITTITALLFGFQYNMKSFTQGSVQKGLINIKGTMHEKQLRAFRRFWYQMMAGIENAWRTPILNAEDVQWHNMMSNNRDMEYNAWIDFQIKILCALMLMDPSEINFRYGNTGQRSTMNEANNKEKIVESKERGLRPMLRFIADLFNRFIIWPINESFEFEFAGLDARTHEQISELNAKRVKTVKTVNELRAEDDDPPLEYGDIILDPVYLQHMQAKEAAAGAAEGEVEGEGAEAGAEELDEDELRRLLGGEEEEKEPEAGGEAKEKAPELPEETGKSFATPWDEVVIDLEL